MLFSERAKLAREYQEWIDSIPEAEDCALNVITYLHGKDLLRDAKRENINPMEFVQIEAMPTKIVDEEYTLITSGGLVDPICTGIIK